MSTKGFYVTFMVAVGLIQLLTAMPKMIEMTANEIENVNSIGVRAGKDDSCDYPCTPQYDPVCGVHSSNDAMKTFYNNCERLAENYCGTLTNNEVWEYYRPGVC